jgi:hypothetical protein
MRLTSRLRRIVGWAVLLLWPALLPHPANAVAACVWYPVLALCGLIYFLSRIEGDAGEEAGTRPAADSNLSADSASSPRQLAGMTSTSGPPRPEGSDSH